MKLSTILALGVVVFASCKHPAGQITGVKDTMVITKFDSAYRIIVRVDTLVVIQRFDTSYYDKKNPPMMMFYASSMMKSNLFNNGATRDTIWETHNANIGR